MQIAVKINGISAVPDDPQAIAVFFIKTESHSRFGIIGTELARMHQPRGLIAQDAGITILSILEVRNHKPRHIGCGSGQRAGGIAGNHFKRLRVVRSPVVTIGH